MAKVNTVFVRDAAERIATTFLEAWLGLWVASGIDIVHGVTNLSLANKALVASVPAALALLKSVAAKSIGDSNSASLDPEVATAAKPRRQNKKHRVVTNKSATGGKGF